jgi:hypothetical protein
VPVTSSTTARITELSDAITAGAAVLTCLPRMPGGYEPDPAALDVPQKQRNLSALADLTAAWILAGNLTERLPQLVSAAGNPVQLTWLLYIAAAQAAAGGADPAVPAEAIQLVTDPGQWNARGQLFFEVTARLNDPAPLAG